MIDSGGELKAQSKEIPLSMCTVSALAIYLEKFKEVRTLRIEANREGEVLYTDLNLFWCLQKRSRDWIYTNNFEEFIHERS